MSEAREGDLGGGGGRDLGRGGGIKFLKSPSYSHAISEFLGFACMARPPVRSADGLMRRLGMKVFG